MKKIVLLLTVILIYMTSYSQNIIAYDYDDSGNRIARYVVVLKTSKVDTSGKTDIKEYKGLLGKQNVSVFPNPTQGIINVQFTEIPAEVTILEIYDMNGRIIHTVVLNGTSSIIDLSGQSSGTYIMIIRSGTLKSEWKVIKE